MINTTLNRIREHSPCRNGWEKLLRSLGKTKADDEPLNMLSILDSNGIEDCLWCARSTDGHDRFWRHTAVDFAMRVEHQMNDERSENALRVARLHANGMASDEKLAAARNAAGAAAWAAAGAAAGAAAARAAAGSAARAAARAAENKWQTEHLRAALSDPDAYLSSKRGSA